MHIEKLKNSIQNYPWGTSDYIPDLLGINNKDNIPFAELWMGTHPRGTSFVLSNSEEIPLNRYIESAPESILGKHTAKAFGNTLPFLFKVLSAARPLSIQAHPDKIQAGEGFQRENNQGIPLDAPNRTYRDTHHKPEIICAVTPFTAMCGFRLPGDIDSLFTESGSKTYKKYLQEFLISGGGNTIADFFTAYLNLDESALSSLVREVVFRAQEKKSLETHLLVDFYQHYGVDPGVLAPFFLNIFTLKPGEALFQGPGILHAYVEGTGIELMANSDNVLRGGMTPKYKNKEELLKILTFTDKKQQILDGEEEQPCVYCYNTPAEEFILKRLLLKDNCTVSMNERGSVEIIICIKGSGTFRSADQVVSFTRGDSFMIPADIPSYTMRGSGECFIASVPE